MPKDVIGTAYVRIVAMSQDFEKQVQASFDRLKPMAAKSGEESSKAWTDGFEKHFGQTMAEAHDRIQQDLADSWDKAGIDHGGGYGTSFGDESGTTIIDGHDATVDEMGKSWADAGARHGTAYGDPLAVEIDRAMGRSVEKSTNLWRGSNLMRFTLEDLQKLADDMPNILGGGADDSGRRVRQSLRNSFQNIGQDVRQTFANVGQGLSAMLSEAFGGGGNSKAFKALTDGSAEASKAFTVLFSMAQLVGSALTVLVAGIANVVSGLFALVSAAGQAGPALAVIPGLISAIAQAGLTMVVGFKGLGKAITEGMKFADSSMSGTAQRSKELATAQRAVASASRAVLTAEQAASRAKKDLTTAQQDLNDAYKEGAKQLRDIQYAAEDAALQEERSAINLANARDELLKVKATNPGDSRAVQEAELAYKEADLAYREARSRNKDASEEANDATKKGVKGTQAVVSAQDRLIRAQENVTSSNQRLADSQIALADAQKNLAETQKGNTGVMKAYNDALKKFGPQGQLFIKTIIKMQSQFRGLKQAAGEGMFRALNIELKQFATGPLFPMLKKNFALTSTAIGGVITKFSDMIQESGNLGSLDRIMKSNTVVIGSMGDAATNLGQAFLSITDAARPMTQEFAKWVAKLTEGWAMSLKADNASGALTDKFDKASRVAKQLGRIFKNMWDAVYGTGRAATSGGALMLNDLEDATKKWSDWVNSFKGQNQLKKYFEDVAPGFRSIMEGINSIAKELMKLGGDRSMTEGLGAMLKEISTWIAPAAGAVSKAMPAFKTLGENIGTIFKALQNSPSLEIFVGVLSTVTGIFAKLTQIPGAGPFIALAGGIMGFARALRFLGIGGKFLSKATLGRDLDIMKKSVSGFGRLLKGQNPFAGMSKGSEEARKEFKKQMLVDQLKAKEVAKVGKASDTTARQIDTATDASKKSRKSFGEKIKGALGFGAGAAAAGGAADVGDDGTGTKKKRSVGSKLGKGLAIGGMALGGVGLAVGALAGVASLNKESAAALGKQISDMAKNLPVALSALAGQIPTILSAISGAVGPLITSIAAALPGVIDSIVKALPQILTAIADALPVVIEAIVKLIPTVIEALAKLLPTLITVIVKLIPKIITALAKAIPAIIKALAAAIPVIIKALATAIPAVIKALADALPVVIKALADAIPQIITALVTAIPQIITALIDAIPQIIDAVITAIPLIIDALIKAVPEIIGAVITAVPQIIGALVTLIPQVVVALVKAIPQIIGALIKAIPQIFGAMAAAFSGALKPIGDFFSGALKSVQGGLSTAKKWIEDRWGEIITFFSGLPAKIGRAVSGMWDGIKTAFKGVINWVIEKWNNLSLGITVPDNFITSALGIANLRFALDTPDIKPLASGGTVAARAGGSLALLGEGGRDEVVKPLDRQGLTAADRQIMEMMRAQSMQIARLVASLTAPLTSQASQVRPLVVSTATTAAITATQRTMSMVGPANDKSNAQVATAIEHLTASVDALQKPLVGGDLTVTAAPGERVVEGTLPRVLRRRAYTRVGAR